MDYDFSQLNDKEFEAFVIDLFSCVLKHRLERFREGKDGGVDGRFFISPQKEVILQCKHFRQSGTKKLIQSLKKDERYKVDILNPSRYILVSSCSLSRSNKTEIAKIFAPHLREDDVFGVQDLNDFLKTFPEVEKNHTKLWMSTSALLRRFLNQAVFARSEQFLIQVSSKRKFYVETQNFIVAQKKLEESKIVILSGEPGVGKTTIAENLCLLYSTRGFEIIDIIKNLSEAENVYFDSKSKQVFLFDDFLGSNYLDAISGKKDAHVVKFMKRIVGDKNKRFILTTRTNILNLGVLRSDYLFHANIRRNEYLLKIGDLTDLEKARMLYNHLWHGHLDSQFLNEIRKDKRYLKIVKHKNYNPRLVEFVTDSLRPEFPDAEKYWDFVLDKFDNPEFIWRNAFYQQSDDYIRALVKILVFMGGGAVESDLKKSYGIYLVDVLKASPQGKARYSQVVEAASKSFIVRSISNKKEVSFSLFNPSIADFVVNQHLEDLIGLAQIFGSLVTVKSLRQLRALSDNTSLGKQGLKAVLEHLNASGCYKKRSDDYRIVFAEIQVDKEVRKSFILEVLEDLMLNPVNLSEKRLIFEWLAEFESAIKVNVFSSLIAIIDEDELDFDEVEALAHFMQFHHQDTDAVSLVEVLEANMSRILEDAIDDWSCELDYEEYVTIWSDEDGDESIDVSSNKLYRDMRKFISEYYDGFPSVFKILMEREFEDFGDNYDFNDRINDWRSSKSSYLNYEDSRGNVGSFSEEELIDDLFRGD